MSATSVQQPADTLKDYDEVPYPGNAFAHSHPTHMAAVARVCGLTPAAPSSCRVLELGSSIGSNLIPMAESLPESSFVGIDLSKRQIESGQAAIDEIGLKNIELRHLNINDVDDSFGKFDYIICHGVYSWVPHDVQEKILSIGRDHLSNNGIMYVSYNTYPGWHLRGAIRDMMRYHAANYESPREKIGQSRELLKFLAESAQTRFEAFHKLLEHEAKSIADKSDSYLYHEFLESVNEPLYFHQFIDRIGAAGLRYVADAEIRTMMSQFLKEDVSAMMRNLPMVHREQYMDFLRARMFRVSLLCKSDATPRYDVPPTCLLPLDVSLTAMLTASKEGDDKIKWAHPQGNLVTTSPMTDVLKLLSSRWPGWVPVQELLDGPLKEAVANGEQTKYLKDLMVGMLQGFFRLAEEPPRIEAKISDKPMCTPYARWQARNSDSLTTRRHVDSKCERLTSLVAEHCDGEHTVEDLAEVLIKKAADGQFKVTLHDDPLEDTKSVDWTPVVRQELARLAAAGLFVS